MKRTLILSSIFMLIYLKNFMISWVIVENPNSIISQPILDLLSIINIGIYSKTYYLLIIFLLFSMLKISSNMVKVSAYMIAILILSIGLEITLDVLSFQDYSTFAIFKVYHPIPLQAKQYYLFTQTEHLLKLNVPEIYYDRNSIATFRVKLLTHLQNTNWDLISKMNPKELNQYACDILNVEPKFNINIPLAVFTIVLATAFVALAFLDSPDGKAYLSNCVQ